MSISGQIYGITDPKAFFPLVLAGQKPAAGFTTLSNQPFQVSMLGFNHANPTIHHSQTATFVPSNCSFTFPDYPAGFHVDDVAINVTINGHPLYRSTVFSYSRALQGGLNIYVNQPTLPPADGISAGDISKQLAGGGLPADTTLTANPWGISVVGDQQGADIQFGVTPVPHTSTNLNVFADLAINGWNIHVGFPADCKVSADGILAQIKAALAADESPLNAFIKTKIMGLLTSLAGSLANDLFGIISVTFTSIKLPNKHSWPLADINDTTIVITVGPTIGYPRKW